MKYLVKTTYIATEKHPHETAGTTQVWYTGKGGYCHSDPRMCEGWNRKHFAEQHIKRWKEIDHELYSSKGAWDVTMEVIEY